MTYSKTGNKKERKLVSANDKPQTRVRRSELPHFFVVGRLAGSFATGTRMVDKIVIQNKSVISWECEPHKTKMGVRLFISPEIPPYVQEKGFAVSLTEMGLISPVFLPFGSPLT